MVEMIVFCRLFLCKFLFVWQIFDQLNEKQQKHNWIACIWKAAVIVTWKREKDGARTRRNNTIAWIENKMIWMSGVDWK